MASFNLTVEDSSPLISYSGSWLDSTNDTSISSYSGSSYHTTSSQGAAANISFYGTGITIYGGHRPDYGTYQISVDNNHITSQSSAGQDAFQQVLGSFSGLSNGQHFVILTSTSSSPIDIDFCQVQTEIGESGSQLSESMIDDTNPSFTYTPQSEWSVNDKDYFMNNTLQYALRYSHAWHIFIFDSSYTLSAGASASVSFSGEAVALYGTVSQDHADIRLTLDGNTVTFGAGTNGFASTLHSQVLLYYIQGLGSNQHTLSVAADPVTGSGPFIDVDAIVVYSTSPGSADTPSIPAPSSSGRQVEVQGSSNNRSTKALIGGIVGGLVGFILLLALLFLLLRWRHRRRQGQDGIRSPLTPTLPIQDPKMLEAGMSARSNASTRLSTNSIASFYSPEVESDGLAQHSRAPSATESFTSTAPIYASHDAVPASHGRNHSMSSNNSTTRPTSRPPPLAL
ncbi:hypothetical protein D9757_004246 [Collybiopsis confluens]|uniref:Transmembrane protein n=1 Tax=Collybiopsis confluens TaxID=2823264 RepID=A0A8H5HTS4_9AGAR|nr:hypothetical protein D9757_004246 [Collybiopsis confluens]